MAQIIINSGFLSDVVQTCNNRFGDKNPIGQPGQIRRLTSIDIVGETSDSYSTEVKFESGERMMSTHLHQRSSFDAGYSRVSDEVYLYGPFGDPIAAANTLLSNELKRTIRRTEKWDKLAPYLFALAFFNESKPRLLVNALDSPVLPYLWSHCSMPFLIAQTPGVMLQLLVNPPSTFGLAYEDLQFPKMVGRPTGRFHHFDVGWDQ